MTPAQLHALANATMQRPTIPAGDAASLKMLATLPLAG